MDFIASPLSYIKNMIIYYSQFNRLEKANMREKYEYVKSLRLAGYLMYNGFRLLRVEENSKVKGKDVYVFKQSDKLSDCILEYIDARTKEKENWQEQNRINI